MKNLLFICSKNQWRSPTGEQIWRSRPGFSARSAGTSSKAKKSVGPADLEWADIIFFMEQKHKNRVVAEYRRVVEHKTMYVLDIPDEYKYMDPELVEILQQSVESLVEGDA